MEERIRAGRQQDAPGIVARVAGLSRDERGREIDHDAVGAASRAGLDSSACDVLVADRDGSIVGYLALHRVPSATLGGTEGYISDLIVARALRGAGVGRRLVAAAEVRAREFSCLRPTLNNRVASEAFERRFYPKLGFRRRDEFANLVKAL